MFPRGIILRRLGAAHMHGTSLWLSDDMMFVPHFRGDYSPDSTKVRAVMERAYLSRQQAISKEVKQIGHP